MGLGLGLGYLFGVIWVEDLLELILEGEVHGLGREISDDVGQISSPEGVEPLFTVNS